MEARTGFEPVMTVLQTVALPLGDRAASEWTSSLTNPENKLKSLLKIRVLGLFYGYLPRRILMNSLKLALGFA